METIDNASHIVMGLGGIITVAGIIQMFLSTISFQRGRRGQIHTRVTLQKPWSTCFGVILIVIGVVLLGGPFGNASN
jgi:hypothetical protein